VFGNPARSHGVVCRCGPMVLNFESATLPAQATCKECGRVYDVAADQSVSEVL